MKLSRAFLGPSCLSAALSASAGILEPNETALASANSYGQPANDITYASRISGNGRYAAYYSLATNLALGDTGAWFDVFLHDLKTGETTLVSRSLSGLSGNESSSDPHLATNGRFVAFRSAASDLVPGDTNDRGDVFVYDAKKETIERVSVASSGAQANEASDGHAISGNGRFVAFSSYATNLVPNDTNDRSDVFVHDRKTGKTERVSIGPKSAQADESSWAPAISASGRHVAFLSFAKNLEATPGGDHAGVFVHDRKTGVTRRASLKTSGVPAIDLESSSGCSISANGRFVTFTALDHEIVPGDTFGWDVFVRDMKEGTTERASLGNGGVAPNGSCRQGLISANGRYVSFGTDATNLVAGDTNGLDDVFVRDRKQGVTLRVSLAYGGAQATSGCYGGGLSDDGRTVVFGSTASNLVPQAVTPTVNAFARRW